MKPVYIECMGVSDMLPQGSAGNRSISIELSMNNRQVREAIGNLIGGMTDEAASDYLRSEFPQFFEVAQ